MIEMSEQKGDYVKKEMKRIEKLISESLDSYYKRYANVTKKLRNEDIWSVS